MRKILSSGPQGWRSIARAARGMDWGEVAAYPSRRIHMSAPSTRRVFFASTRALEGLWSHLQLEVQG